MVYLLHFTSQFSYNGDNVESPGIVNLIIVDVVVYGAVKISLFLIVDSLQRIVVVTVPSCFHLYKHDAVVLLGYDVDVSMF